VHAVAVATAQCPLSIDCADKTILLTVLTLRKRQCTFHTFYCSCHRKTRKLIPQRWPRDVPYGCPENFRENFPAWVRPRLLFTKFLMGLFRSILWICAYKIWSSY